jgi:hypothetical protein
MNISTNGHEANHTPTVTIPLLSIIPGIDYDSLIRTIWMITMMTMGGLGGLVLFLGAHYFGDRSVHFYIRWHQSKRVQMIEHIGRRIISIIADAITDTLLYRKPYYLRNYIVWMIMITSIITWLLIIWYYFVIVYFATCMFLIAASTILVDGGPSLVAYAIQQLQINGSVDHFILVLRSYYRTRAVSSTLTSTSPSTVVSQSSLAIAGRRSRSLISRYITSSIPSLSNDVASIIIDYWWYRSDLPIDMINDDVAQRLIFELWIDISDVKLVKKVDPPSRSWYISAPLRIGHEMDHAPLIRLPVVFIPPVAGAIWDRVVDPWNHTQWGHYQLDRRFLCHHQIEQLNNNWIDISNIPKWLATPTSSWFTMMMLKASRHGYGTSRQPMTWKQIMEYGIGWVLTPHCRTDNLSCESLLRPAPLLLASRQQPPHGMRIIYPPSFISSATSISSSSSSSWSPLTSETKRELPPPSSKRSQLSEQRLYKKRIQQQQRADEELANSVAGRAILADGGGIPLSLTLQLSLQWVNRNESPMIYFNFKTIEPRLPLPSCDRCDKEKQMIKEAGSLSLSSPSSSLLRSNPKSNEDTHSTSKTMTRSARAAPKSRRVKGR